MSRRAPARKMAYRSSAPIPTGPLQLRTNIEHNHQFRFTSSSGAVTPITDLTISTALGVCATTAILGSNIRQSFRVNQIEIWSPPAAQGSAVTCSVLFPVGQRSQAREYTDTSISVSVPAHVKCTPPRESLCRFWTNGATNVPFFTLTAPPGSIIDLWVSMVDGDGGAPATIATLVGATVGAIYYTSLDSSTSAGSLYKPVGLTSL